MKQSDYLIIGGGIAGTSAAEFIRTEDKSGSVTIIMEEPEVLYSRVLLPHYLRNQVQFERIYLRKEDQYKEKKIDLLKDVRASKIDTQNKTVFLSNGEDIKYRKLLIASGGKVNKLQVPGADIKGVTYLRTINDVREIKDRMTNAKNGVVIGSGFIGVEFAQGFVKANLKTTCIIRESFFWSNVVGDNMGRLINEILQENGVQIISETEVTRFVGNNSLQEVKLKNGQTTAAEIAGVGIGIHMNLDYFKGSGLKINKGVITNEYLETDTPDVWAAGDIAQFYDVIFNKRHQMGNWSNAAAQGKVAGSNMVAGWGGNVREKFITVSAYTINIFDKTFVFMGDSISDETTEIIERGSIEKGKLGRIYLRDGVITGAALINLSADRRPIEELIKNRVKITIGRDKLADINFNLNNLLPG